MPIPASTDPAFEPIPIFKDGRPGWIVGDETTVSDGDFFDIELDDGTLTFARSAVSLTPREVTAEERAAFLRKRGMPFVTYAYLHDEGAWIIDYDNLMGDAPTASTLLVFAPPPANGCWCPS